MVWVVTTAFVIATLITVKLPHGIAGRHCRRRDFWRASSPALPDLIGFLRLGWAARVGAVSQLSTFRATLAEAGLRRTADYPAPVTLFTQVVLKPAACVAVTGHAVMPVHEHGALTHRLRPSGAPLLLRLPSIATTWG
jgi:hypothetical protein